MTEFTKDEKCLLNLILDKEIKDLNNHKELQKQYLSILKKLNYRDKK